MSSAIAHPTAETDFASFDFDTRLARGLAATGFTTPRPIQVETIPACLDGQDVLGLAQTGTGKTAAFALPILQSLLEEPGRGPFALILAPTRELAIQIDAEIRSLARFTKIETATLFGGIPISKQVRALKRSPEILVGCPGRVLDLIGQRILELGSIDTLVLDEADHMFDMGFLPDIERILAKLPSDRQNLLFSATMPKSIRSLANKVLDKPHVVELAHSKPAAQIEHGLYPTQPGRKKALLTHVLGEEDCGSAIVFTRTKHRAKRMAIQLERDGHKAVALQGNMSQAQRDRAMRGFREGRFDILVATDIAARGLDVAGVDYVINFDPPSTPETYTHRIGRTGRSEASGKAVTFVTNEDRGWVRDTERVLGSTIPRLDTPAVAADPDDAFSNEPARERRPRSSRPSSRPSGRRPASRSKHGRSEDRPQESRNRSGEGRRSRNGESASASPRRRPRNGESASASSERRPRNGDPAAASSGRPGSAKRASGNRSRNESRNRSRSRGRKPSGSAPSAPGR